MRNFFKRIKELQRNSLYYVCFAAQALSIIVYIISIRGLEKPAGLIESAKFLFSNPGSYTIAIIVGILAWFIFSVLLISNFMELPIIKDLIEYDDYHGNYGGYGVYEDVPKEKMILNIILCIIAFILNMLYLRFLLSLLGIIMIIIIVAIIYAWSSK